MYVMNRQNVEEQILDLRSRGKTYAEIADSFNSSGVDSPSGKKKWTQYTISKFVQRREVAHLITELLNRMSPEHIAIKFNVENVRLSTDTKEKEWSAKKIRRFLKTEQIDHDTYD